MRQTLERPLLTFEVCFMLSCIIVPKSIGVIRSFVEYAAAKGRRLLASDELSDVTVFEDEINRCLYPALFVSVD